MDKATGMDKQETLKDQILKSIFQWPNDQQTIDSCIRQLCRNCTDGKCRDQAQQGWEDIHHKDIYKAVFMREKEETVYFLNNIKSMPGSQYMFDMNNYDESTANKQMKEAYHYRSLLYNGCKRYGYAYPIYCTQLKFGYHRKDKASEFALKKNKIQSAIRSAVPTLVDVVINTVTDFLDDKCSFCEIHLGVNFLPNHPNPRLSCYACKVSTKSIITQKNAIKKYPKLTGEVTNQLIAENKSETVDNKIIFFVDDVEILYVDHFGSLEVNGNEDDYYEIDEKIEEDLEEEMMRDFSY